MSYETQEQEISCFSCQQIEEEEKFSLFGRKNFFDKFIINQLSAICFTTSILLTLIICSVTFVRYVLKGDLYGYEEWVKLIAFWLYFMGAAAGAYNRTHVSADLVNAYLQDGPLKDGLIVLRNLITLGVCLLFTWFCYKFFEFGYVGPVYLAQGKAMVAKEWLKLAAFWLYFAGGVTLSCYVSYFIFSFLHRKNKKALLAEPEEIRERGVSWLDNMLFSLISFVFFAVCIFFVALFFKFFLFDFIGAPETGIAIRMTSLWRIGCWTGYLSVFIGFVLMSLYFFRDLLLSIVDIPEVAKFCDFKGGKKA